MPPEFLELIKPALPLLESAWQIFQAWWWVILPFLFWKPFLLLWLYWRSENWDRTIKKIILEIKMPKEVLKPIKAMEQVFAGFHAIHDVITWREKWLEGQFQLSIALEIASIDGEVHFFIRTPEGFRKIIESNIYSQYPETEIFEVDDYTKNVPQDIPSKDWDLFGMGFINSKPDPYPIKTYPSFEADIEPKEEKRIDPLAGLLEGMAALRPGEQLWVQIGVKPIRNEISWVEEGQKLRDKLARRPEKPKSKSLIWEAAEVLVSGPPKTVEAVKEVMPPEMKLTPGERAILLAIEEKIGKFGFSCYIRFIYLGKKDVFFKPMARIPYGFFKEVSTENLGGLKPDKRTITKIKSVPFWFLDSRRVYMRKRRLFRYYQKRFIPFFPRHGPNLGTFILNTEELATLYHFPSRMVAPAPGVPRVEAKKGEAPPGLPVG